jgi:hypothetical protein
MAFDVLILAPEDDSHAAAVEAVLTGQLGASVARWDTSRLPASDTATLYLAGSPRFRIAMDHSGISLSELTSIWWRRPSRFVLGDDLAKDQEVSQFCWRECEHFFKGSLDAADVNVVNDPSVERAATKPVQLVTAENCGLAIPRTIMSNDPAAIREFWEECKHDCIYKPFTATSWRMAETRRLEERDLDNLSTLRHAPMIVQKRIAKHKAIRITVFDDMLFAGAVRINRNIAELDWRLDLTAGWDHYELPKEVSHRLCRLLSALRLRYGSIDMIETPDGEFVFLEVNPSGQFLFLEIDTHQPLSRACAEMLLRPPAGHSQAG